METTLPGNVYTVARKIAVNVFIGSIDRVTLSLEGNNISDVQKKAFELINNISSITALSILNSEKSFEDMYSTITSEALNIGNIFIDAAVVFYARLYNNPEVSFEGICDCLANSLCIYKDDDLCFHMTEASERWDLHETKRRLLANPLHVMVILLTMEPMYHESLQDINDDKNTGPR